MTTDKMEPRLLERVEASKRREQAVAAAVPEPDRARHPVLFVLDGRPDTSGDTTDRRAVMTEVADQLRNVAGPVETAISAAMGRQGELLPLARSVRAELTEAEIDAVAARDEVTVVLSDHRDRVALLNESTKVIELPDTVADLTGPGFTATGDHITVAVVDSGIDDTHPALFGRVKDSYDATGAGLVGGHHGTHVAGIIASNDPVYGGVAPGAELINVQVLDVGGFGQPSWVIDGLQEAFLRGADVVNLSLGWSEIFHGWLCNDADCILCQAIDSIVRLGVVAVVAAGNEGASAVPPQHNIRHPGAARGAITVGSTDKSKQVSWFSSIGPGSGRLSPGSPTELTKPDVAAPGDNIVSTFPGGAFVALSGTSMASPHVAGLAALLLEKDNTLRPKMVRKLLENACEDLVLSPNQAGYGLVNAYGALM
jgi:serine protease AprX